jgi:hypothetical protein
MSDEELLLAPPQYLKRRTKLVPESLPNEAEVHIRTPLETMWPGISSLWSARPAKFDAGITEPECATDPTRYEKVSYDSRLRPVSRLIVTKDPHTGQKVYDLQKDLLSTSARNFSYHCCGEDFFPEEYVFHNCL